MPVIDPVVFDNALDVLRDYLQDTNAPPAVDGALSQLEEFMSSEAQLRVARWFATFDAALAGAGSIDPFTARSRAKLHADAVHGVLPPGALATVF